MSYTPTEWKTGDVITADKLNNMESGIAYSGVFVITATNVASKSNPQTQPTLDKTFLEITDAIKAGKVPVLKMIVSSSSVIFENNAGIVYANGDITVVNFNYNRAGFNGDGTQWDEALVETFISSDGAMSRYSEVSLNPAT